MNRGDVVEVDWPFTRDQSLILRTVGLLSDAAMKQIEACLRAVLEIP